MTEWMTKVKMQKVVLLAEFDRNRDGREVGCRDYSGEAEEQCHRQTNQQTDRHTVKKTKTPVPHKK